MAMNKINVKVIVEKRECCSITKEMVQAELEAMDDLERCCDDSEAMRDLVDIIFERIVEYLKNCGNTLDESECGWDLFNSYGLDDEEVVKYLIKQVFYENNDGDVLSCSKCWENK
jgi:hypothetical protein